MLNQVSFSFFHTILKIHDNIINIFELQCHILNTRWEHSIKHYIKVMLLLQNAFLCVSVFFPLSYMNSQQL